MNEQYPAICMGYLNQKEGKFEVAPHEFLADHEVLKGSHTICPECQRRYYVLIHGEDKKRKGLENTVGNA